MSSIGNSKSRATGITLFRGSSQCTKLHSIVYMKHLTNLDQCIYETIEYDDSCSKEATGNGSQTSEPTAKVPSQVDEIIQGVTEECNGCMGRQELLKDTWIGHTCGVCGGNYPTLQCIPKNQGMVRPEPQQALWL